MHFLVHFWNKQALVIFFKDQKLHSPHGLVQFCYSLKKFTRAYLFQIPLEIIWLPTQKPLQKTLNIREIRTLWKSAIMQRL